MRVDKIEVSGFKSFGDRTVFNLHPGITCIVGPNGCGKSNVVDAFKWVLGEQSVKSLRGGKMEEVIFAGSSTKKPKGMAEVSLHMAGMGGSIGLGGSGESGGQDNGRDSSTVVTRRLYRSGESEYLLNREACRLRDIRDIFLDTGLEVKSYSILEQDRVSSILTAKPEDRRFLIEEVAGVIKYKVRRHEARNKLEASRTNLARVTDIVGEVRRQLNSLDRQARKAERYKKLIEEMRDIELKLARRDWEFLSVSLAEILTQHEGARESDASLRAELSRIETDIETRRIALTEEEKRLDALQAELQNRERQIAAIERAVAVSRTEMEHQRENILRLRLQSEENEAKRASALARKAEIASLREGIGREITELEGRGSEQGTGLKAQEDSIRDREHNLDTRRRDSFRVTDETGTLRSELHKYTTSFETLGKKDEDLRRELGELSAYLAEIESGRQEIQGAILNRNNELMVLRGEREAMEREANSLKEKLEQLRGALTSAREELASSVSRIESLQEMDMAESSEESLKAEVAILAAVSDIIEVPKDYERAIEGALREAVNGFVVSGYDEIKKALAAVEAKGLQRTAFVPASLSGAASRPSMQQGVLAYAPDVVKARDGYAGLAARLLERVVIVKDMDAAVRLASAGIAGITAVTLSGEVLEPSGAVVAGKSRGILALKRQIRELTSEIEVRRQRAASVQRNMDEAHAALSEKLSALEKTSTRAIEAEKEISILRLKAEKNAEESDRGGRKQAHLKLDLDNIARERQELGVMIERKKAEVSRLETGRSEIEGAISALQAEIALLREDYERKRAESVSLGLELNSRRERMTAMETEDKGIAALVEELASKDELIKREISSTEARIETLGQEAGTKEEELRGVVVAAGTLREQLATGREAVEARLDEVKGAEQGLRSLRLRIDDSTHRLSELEVQKAEHRLRLDNLAQNIRNVYAVELPALELKEVTPEDEARMPEIKEKLDSIGPVSLGSIDEYEDLRQRHEFLSKQQEDLLKSIAELEEAIARINATTRKKLREAYDALREKFSEVFVNLFGGGRAELVLTDESNILETGLDVIAQPPGKRFQNITLLSGGEKTLTALALLFAGFLIKPTPLCILDEADAALDESNTHKFAALVRGISSEIQILVVTHNRVTMEAADHIYGITMEEPGNSKVISLEMSRT